LFSSKTYKESSAARQPTENQFSNMSSEHWKDWVIEQRQEYSQRKKSARLTNESESSSWQTPTTMDIERTPEGMEKRKAYRESIGRKYVEGCLTEQVKNWPTASARDWKDTAGMSTERDGKALGRVDQLPRAVYHHDGLQDQANPNTNGKSQGSWGTPRSSTAMSATITENLVNRNVGNLEEQQGRQSIGGKLNPNWVEHLMGLPAGWTDLGSWETE
jgi:hypothetical protein